MEDPTVERWAASGLMALTGSAARPLGPPSGLMERLDQLAASFPGLDAPALLGERAALMGLWRRGSISCGGSCHLVASSEGWVAVSLPREEDRDLVPAWLELSSPPATEPATWSVVRKAFAERDASALLERAVLLGLPVARVGEMNAPGVMAGRLGDAPPLSGPEDLLVVDLSSLWAGPLCGDLLARAGARVVKVESTSRPDGARRGPVSFFALLNGAKRSVALDFNDPTERALLGRLVHTADVVIEASRPRALEQLGIVAADMVASGPRLWLSITAYGRQGVSGNRVGFGDDAAAAGGLVAWSDEEPAFCSDAIADPLTGLTAAAGGLQALQDGGRWLLDVAMAGVAASFAGPTLAAPEELVPAPPSARRPLGTAPALGADNAEVMAELGLEG
jgi:CoA-transferase family III